MASNQFFQTGNIFAAVFRKLLETLALRNIFLESLKLLVNRSTSCKLFKCRREVFNNSAVRLFICNADFKSIYSGKSIQLVYSKTVKTVYSYGMTNDNGIEPACSSRSACSSTKFSAYVSDLIADLIIKLCGERSLSDTSCVSLGNADNIGYYLRSYARSDANSC